MGFLVLWESPNFNERRMLLPGPFSCQSDAVFGVANKGRDPNPSTFIFPLTQSLQLLAFDL